VGINDWKNQVSELKAEVSSAEALSTQEPNTTAYRDAVDSVTKATANLKSINSRNGPTIARTLTQIQSSQRAGEQSADQELRVAALRRQVTQLQQEIIMARSSLTSAQNAKEQIKKEWIDEQQDRLLKAKRQLDSARDQTAKAEESLVQRNGSSERELDKLAKPDLVNQFRMLRRITQNPKHPDAEATRTIEFALHFLFFFLEISPVLWKVLVAKRGPLDAAIESIEEVDKARIKALEEERKARANNDANIAIYRQQQLADAKVLIQEEAIKVWQDAVLTRIHGTLPTTEHLMQIYEELDSVAA
jgi:hypothetical protein